MRGKADDNKQNYPEQVLPHLRSAAAAFRLRATQALEQFQRVVTLETARGSEESRLHHLATRCRLL